VVVALGLTVYANTARDDFAWDDVHIVANNDAVSAGDMGLALTSSYWPKSFVLDHGRLWRPFTVATFALEWSVFGDGAGAFHLVNAAAHAGVSLLVFLLLCQWVGTIAAGIGAAVFAVHPVHTEAVANVVGLSELGAAAGCLVACLLYLKLMDARSTASRVGLSTAIAASYMVALGFKEIGVTLPALLLLMAWARERGSHRGLWRRLGSEAPLFALLAAILGTYLVVRTSILGVTLGDMTAPELVGLGTGARLLTAVSLWTDYARLLVFPLDLSADYGPAVRFPTHAIDGLVVVGAMVAAGVILGAVASRRKAPTVALGLAWVPVAMLPVSHLLFPAGILFGERTLYLASIGLALTVAGAAEWVGDRGPAAARIGIAGAVLITMGFGVRTWVRNRDWRDNDTVLASLARDHPESYVVARMQALHDMSVGDERGALALFARAVRLEPNSFLTLTEAAQYYRHLGLDRRAEVVLRQATRAFPANPYPWAMLARLRLDDGDVAESRRIALEGLEASRIWLPDLWRIVSEGYAREGRSLDAGRASVMTRHGATLYGS
jgi:hypothetical protein